MDSSNFFPACGRLSAQLISTLIQRFEQSQIGKLYVGLVVETNTKSRLELENAGKSDLYNSLKKQKMLHLKFYVFCSLLLCNHRGRGPNGVAVLQTIGNTGGCSDDWGNILKVSKDAIDQELESAIIDQELERALEYKFQRKIPLKPLKTVYKYWEDGFW